VVWLSSFLIVELLDISCGGQRGVAILVGIEEEFKDDLVLGPCINSGWSKLSKYHDKTSDSPAYVAAIVLDPAYKWEYIEKTWEQIWIQGARVSRGPLEVKIQT
jgi:hypothetical protein